MELGLVLALEAVAVEQRQEELEVLLLAAVRRGRHQQEVAADLAELLAELEAFGLLELAAEVMGAHAVSLVDDHEIPLRLRKLGAQLVVTGELIHPGDQKRMLLEGRRAEHRLAELRGKDLEGEPELQIELVLPLLDETAGHDDQAALHVLAEDQLLDVQPRHDRLAGARVIGKQEAQRRAGQAARRRPPGADAAAAGYLRS